MFRPGESRRISEGDLSTYLELLDDVDPESMRETLAKKRQEWLALVEQTKKAYTIVFLHNKQGTHCILQRSNLGKGDYLDDKFSTWGGKVEKGESIEEAALREVMEEVGVKLDEARIIGAIFIKSTGAWLFYYDCEADTDFADIKWQGREGRAWIGRWVDLDILMSTSKGAEDSQIPPNFRDVLEMYRVIGGGTSTSGYFFGTVENDFDSVNWQAALNVPGEYVTELADEVAKFIAANVAK